LLFLSVSVRGDIPVNIGRHGRYPIIFPMNLAEIPLRRCIPMHPMHKCPPQSALQKLAQTAGKTGGVTAGKR